MMLRKLLPAALLALTAAAAQAGTYSYLCNTNVKCDELFSDLVTERFTTRYNSNKWELFVVADFIRYSDNTGSGMALVGVRPRAGKNDTGIFPSRYWTYHRYSPTVKTAYDVAEEEKQVIRSAVTELMAACDNTQNCKLD